MRNYLQRFYGYVFGSEARPAKPVPLAPINVMEERKQTEIMHFFFREKSPRVIRKKLFRAALRYFNNATLEITLYGNNTDKLHVNYSYPDDEQIKNNFITLNNKYRFLNDTAFENFKMLFKLLKLIGDTVELSNTPDNKVIVSSTIIDHV